MLKMKFYSVVIHTALTSGQEFDAHEFFTFLLNYLLKSMPSS